MHNMTISLEPKCFRFWFCWSTVLYGYGCICGTML